MRSTKSRRRAVNSHNYGEGMETPSVGATFPDSTMTKDAVAECIQRLQSMADRKAKQDGIPDTESAVTPDLLEVTSAV